MEVLTAVIFPVPKRLISLAQDTYIHSLFSFSAVWFTGQCVLGKICEKTGTTPLKFRKQL